MKRIFESFLLFVIICIILSCLYLLFMFTPYIYDAVFGEKVINEHINQVVGNLTDHKEITASLLEWVNKNVYYPKQEERIFWVFYKIDNKLRVFFRDTPAPWTIKTKLGRCGEDAKYFVEVMNKIGFKSRIIRPVGWDHNWVEYYTPEGYKIVLDPSSNRTITNLTRWVEGKNVKEIFAFNLNGTKYNITSEYIK